MVESARRHAAAGCLACVGCLAALVLLAYEVGPVVRLDLLVAAGCFFALLAASRALPLAGDR